MNNSVVTPPFDDAELAHFERTAVDAAAAAGEYVFNRLFTPMDVESKTGRPGRDLVTDVDRNSQGIIEKLILGEHPDHQILGEEDQKEDVDPASDLVWALDPIDGTANYVNGSLTHAVSVGLMYRGVPIVGAVWSPWASPSGIGTTLHARLNGGAKRDGVAIRVLEPTDEQGRPVSGRLSVLPGNARSVFKFDRQMIGHAGDVRITGSASHEMSNVATGLYQYCIGGTAAVWDFAAAVIIVREAGGEVMSLRGDGDWKPFQGWADPYANDKDTFKLLRDWRGIILGSHPKTVQFIAENVRFRRPNRLATLFRRRNRMPRRPQS